MTSAPERVGIALALLLLAAALMSSIGWTQTADQPPAFDPEFFPRIVLWVLMALTAAGLIAESLLKGGVSADNVLRSVVLALGMLCFAWAMARYGFFLTGAAFSVLALPLLGARNPLVIVGFALLVPGSIVGLFNHVLTMPLPTSPFSYMF